MKHRDDDTGVKHRRHLSDRTADRLLRGKAVPEQPALTDFVAELSALVPDAPPAPSYQLAALLEQGPPVNTNALIPRIGAQRQSHRLRRLSLASTAFLGLLLAAAAVNTLPDPAQQVVSDVVGWATPLHLPAPDEHQPATRPTPAATPRPAGASTAPASGPSDEPATSTPSEEPSEATPSPEATEPTEEPSDEPTDEATTEPSEEPTDDATEPSGPADLGLSGRLPRR